MVAGNVTEADWIPAVKGVSGTGQILCIAEGLFMCFSKEEQRTNRSPHCNDQ